MSKDAVWFWGFVTVFVLAMTFLFLGLDVHNSVTDERGCIIQSYTDNRVFGEDTHSVQTYCPVEANND